MPERGLHPPEIADCRDAPCSPMPATKAYIFTISSPIILTLGLF
jgi:hypothetical protein